MTNVLIYVATLVWVALLFYMMGRRHGRDVAESQQRLSARIDPPRRTQGLPTNKDAPPSEVRQARWRAGQFLGRDKKEW